MKVNVAGIRLVLMLTFLSSSVLPFCSTPGVVNRSQWRFGGGFQRTGAQRRVYYSPFSASVFSITMMWYRDYVILCYWNPSMDSCKCDLEVLFFLSLSCRVAEVLFKSLIKAPGEKKNKKKRLQFPWEIFMVAADLKRWQLKLSSSNFMSVALLLLCRLERWRRLNGVKLLMNYLIFLVHRVYFHKAVCLTH